MRLMTIVLRWKCTAVIVIGAVAAAGSRLWKKWLLLVVFDILLRLVPAVVGFALTWNTSKRTDTTLATIETL